MRSIAAGRILITIAESSRILGEKPKAIYSMIRCQVLPPGVAVRIGRKVRIHRERLLAWLEAGGQALPGGWKRKLASLQVRVGRSC